MSDANVVAPIAAVLVTLVGGAWDAQTGRIPNWLTHTVLVGAPLASLVHALFPVERAVALESAGGAVLGAIACGAFPLLLFARRGLGAGDVKLFACVGVLLGWRAGLDAQCFALALGALFVLGRLAWRRRLGAFAFGMVDRVRRRGSDAPAELTETLRLGPAIFAGTAIAVILRSLAVRGIA
jgi:prepilin peptidase CpaA